MYFYGLKGSSNWFIQSCFIPLDETSQPGNYPDSCEDELCGPGSREQRFYDCEREIMTMIMIETGNVVEVIIDENIVLL